MADEKRELINVGEVDLILDAAKEQVIGVNWRWTENVTSAIGAVSTINSLKASLRDVGWTTSVVMAATPRTEEDPTDTQSPTPVDQATATEVSDNQEPPAVDLSS